MAVRALVRGAYRIDPPLKLSDIKRSSFLSAADGGSDVRSVVLLLEREEEETDEQVIVTVTCSRAIPWTSSTFDPQGLLEDVKELRAECEGRTVEGQMVAYDTELVGYVTRVVSDSDGVRQEAARMIWPDGSEVESLY